MISRAYKVELEDLLRDAVFVVEASSYERQNLWERFAKEAADLSPSSSPRIDWNDCGHGWVIEVGTLDNRPVVMSIFGSLLNGKPVVFYDVHSQVVDWAQIEAWFKENCWPKWDNNSRRAHCDAMNFHHCYEVVKQ